MYKYGRGAKWNSVKGGLKSIASGIGSDLVSNTLQSITHTMKTGGFKNAGEAIAHGAKQAGISTGLQALERVGGAAKEFGAKHGGQVGKTLGSFANDLSQLGSAIGEHAARKSGHYKMQSGGAMPSQNAQPSTGQQPSRPKGRSKTSGKRLQGARGQRRRR